MNSKTLSLIAQIPLIAWLENTGACPESVKLFETRAAAEAAATDAAWDAAADAAEPAPRDAAWSAAMDAAQRAAEDASRGDACDTVREAVCDAFGSVARSAATARRATWDAALLASLHVCNGLPIDPKHMGHAKLRWSVWEAGYGVLCDVDGVIYAYKRI